MKIKIQFAILLFVIAGRAISQQLPEGTFFYSTGFEYSEFTFRSNLRFDYLFSSCTGGWKGSGTYKYRRNKLTLIVDDSSSATSPLGPIISKQESLNDTAFLNFKFFNQKDSTPTPGITIKYRNKMNSTWYGTTSDELGLASLEIHKRELPNKIEVSYLAMDTHWIKLDSIGIYSIVFPLNFDFIKPFPKGKLLEFKVYDFDNNQILMKERKSNDYYNYKLKE